MKLLMENWRGYMKEAQWGGFTGGAAPLDPEQRELPALSYEEQLDLFSMIVDRGDMDPKELLYHPENIQNGLEFPDLSEDDVEDILDKLGLPELGDPSWQQNIVGRAAVSEVASSSDAPSYMLYLKGGTETEITLTDEEWNQLGLPDPDQDPDEALIAVLSQTRPKLVQNLEDVERLAEEEEISKKDVVAQAWEKAGATSRDVSDDEANSVESFNNWRDAERLRQKDWEPAQSYRGGRVLAYHRQENGKSVGKYYDVQADMYVDDEEMDAILPEATRQEKTGLNKNLKGDNEMNLEEIVRGAIRKALKEKKYRREDDEKPKEEESLDEAEEEELTPKQKKEMDKDNDGDIDDDDMDILQGKEKNEGKLPPALAKFQKGQAEADSDDEDTSHAEADDDAEEEKKEKVQEYGRDLGSHAYGEALQEAEYVGHHAEIDGKTYVDSNFLNSVKKLRDTFPHELKHMGFGEFYLETPEGKVDFDRSRGKEFAGMVGRSHQLSSNPPELADKLIDAMEQAGASETPLPTEEPPPDLEEASNKEWYDNQLFESLMKKWVK
jgi:hypothetical protein